MGNLANCLGTQNKMLWPRHVGCKFKSRGKGAATRRQGKSYKNFRIRERARGQSGGVGGAEAGT